MLVYAWPRDNVVESGKPFVLTPVARARIGTDGAFTARVAPGIDLRRHATAGVADFSVSALTGGRMDTWAFSRRVPPPAASVLPSMTAGRRPLCRAPAHPLGAACRK